MQNENTEKMHHGHVRERPDKTVEPCGGPAICLECSAELSQFGMKEIEVLRKQLIQWQLAIQPSEQARVSLINENIKLKSERDNLLRRIGELDA